MTEVEYREKVICLLEQILEEVTLTYAQKENRAYMQMRP